MKVDQMQQAIIVTENDAYDVTSFKKNVNVATPPPHRYMVFFKNTLQSSLPARALATLKPDVRINRDATYRDLAGCSFPKNAESLQALQKLATKVGLQVIQNTAHTLKVPARRLEVNAEGGIDAVLDEVTLHFPAAEHVVHLHAAQNMTEEAAQQLLDTIPQWAPQTIKDEQKG